MDEELKQIITGIVLFIVICTISIWLASDNYGYNPDIIGCNQYECY